MLGCKAAVQSYAHARKAQRILAGYGYSCQIRRMEQLSGAVDGCSYELLVQGDCTTVSDILKTSGVAYQRLENMRRNP